MLKIIALICLAWSLVAPAQAQLRLEIDPGATRRGPSIEVGPRREYRDRDDDDSRTRRRAFRQCRAELDDDYSEREMRSCMRHKGF